MVFEEMQAYHVEILVAHHAVPQVEAGVIYIPVVFVLPVIALCRCIKVFQCIYLEDVGASLDLTAASWCITRLVTICCLQVFSLDFEN